MRKSYPACQPNVIVSTPSVERRLNSWYCKVKTNYDYCLKYALAPKLCSSEKIKKPPSECLSDDLSHLSEIENGLNLKRNRFMVLFFPDTPPLSPESLERMRRQQDKQRLQRDTQNQNNRQMNNMLKNTTPKLRR